MWISSSPTSAPVFWIVHFCPANVMNPGFSLCQVHHFESAKNSRSANGARR